MMRPVSCLLLLLLLAVGSRSADAGVMLHGVRCGVGPDLAQATQVLNKRIATFDGMVGVSHQGLDVLAIDQQVVACTLVNSTRVPEPESGETSAVRCVSLGTPDALSRYGDHSFPSPRTGLLTSLDLSVDDSGRISACALAVRAKPPSGRARRRP